MKKRPAEERFWAFVGPPDHNGCRRWLGARHHATGYGVFKLRMGKQVQAHAFAWRSTYYGPVPAEATVHLHSCDIHHPPGSHGYQSCCEPSHVYPGTPRQNVHDAIAKGRMAKGERSPKAKLSDDSLTIIRARLQAGDRQVDIAMDFGVKQSAISRVKRGVRTVTSVRPEPYNPGRPRTRMLTLNGHTRSIRDWSSLTGIPFGTIKRRLRLGWTQERILTTVDGRVSQVHALSG